MSNQEIVVRCSFPDVDLATAHDLCDDLHSSIVTGVPEAEVTRERDNRLHQDLGTVLTIALTSPTVGLIVRELGRWAARRHDATLRVTDTETGASLEVEGAPTARHERMMRDFLDGIRRA
ncbi:hypothetical protein NONO_c73050 [Nocardia nova SH22a]|uniref:Uncharacterized protein n=1 Tax=Nocardia nova SH22a TaxID=1415166 RepID=W5TS07_9NOCA|nr:hypothetical protein [Nocardia nova]AHH22062.1 hypothetical protein NONO_c73050 [Nocardia nova SH22a]